MAVPRKVLLFGDQTVDPSPIIKQLHRRSLDSVILQSFFQKASDVLRYQIALCEPSERSSFPFFDSIQGLSDVYSRGDTSNEAISTALLCISQLGLLLTCEEDNEDIFDTHRSSRPCLLGLCTGMLPAAAVAVTQSTSQLLDLAPEIVRLSLCLGLEANRRSVQIERSNESWAFLVPGKAPKEQQELLDKYHQDHVVPISKRAYVSAEAESSATISGPPSTLVSLFSSAEFFKTARKIKLPITAAFHAPHLGSSDAIRMLDCQSRYRDLPVRKDIDVISTGSGKPIPADSLGDLLKHIVDDTLHDTLRWSHVVDEILSSFSGQDATISSAGPVHAANSLSREMAKARIEVVDRSEMKPTRDNQNSKGSNDIAIVGFASRLPETETLEEVWELLEKGKDVHKKIPADRFDVDTHCDPTGKTKNTIITPFGCFLDRPGHFDARLFNMSPREAAQTDPGQRLLLLTTYEALEMAGYSPGATPSYASERMGTFFGQTLDDYREANAGQDIEMYYVTGGIRAFGAGRLNYHFKWEGPSYCVDAACSSSALSIQMAMTSLRTHECDTAVAGGTNVLTGSDMYSGLSRGSFLSPTGSCKTFDNDADGYCRGEGVGTVILKRLDDAIAEGDNIQAVIKSAATNHSAYASSITHPHAGAQQKLMRQVLREANLEPDDIDYAEMHGTGTQAGDATEFSSVTNVLANRSKNNPLHIGAVKANVGHAEAAAGTNSLTKILMMMRKNAIPPHVGIKGQINEKFPPLDQVGVRINRSLAPFKARAGGDGKRRVLLNNFNATGGNTSLVIEDAPHTSEKGQDPRATQVVAVSAKTAGSFKKNTQRLLEYVEANPALRLQDLAYTTTSRRMHHVYRKAYAVESVDQLLESLRKDVASSSNATSTTETSSAVFAFTGQGAQYVGMGRQLFETSTAFRKNILDYDSICVRQGLPSFKGLVIDASPAKSSPTQSQLALVSIAMALASLWQSWGITPAAVIGHSLGEYAALAVAGVLSASDALYLVGKRAQKMEEKCLANSHAMLAVQSTAEFAQQTLSSAKLQSCEIACLNGPSATVVSGMLTDIALLKDKLAASGVKTTQLDLPYAFHSQNMDPILDDIRTIAANVKFSEPSIPVASTLLGSLVREKGSFTPDYLARQARHSVKFETALKALRSDGVVDDKTSWIEVGAQPLCLSMVRQTLSLSPTKALPSLKRDEECWATLSKSIANAYNSGLKISWTDFHRDFQSVLQLLELPTYAFDLKKYWLDYEGDWLLTKSNSPAKVAPSNLEPGFSTTCLQHVESEIFTKDSAAVTFTSQLGEPKLNTAVRGHLVNGIGLCPSSVYADVAFTAAWYIASRMSPSQSVPAMDLSTMEVFRPLIVDAGETAQVLKVTASRKPNEQFVKLSISSKDAKDTHEHAHCTVIYGDGKSWMEDWKRNAYLVESRMDHLIQPATKNVHKLLKEMIYKQFQTVVTYAPQYHNIDELYMDCDLNESVANINFQPTAGNGEFKYSPYWIDTVAHLGGFILNASVKCPPDTVFISHGWDSFRIAAPLSSDKQYRGYVRMQAVGSKGVQAGDVYIMDGDEVVVLCRGLKFQQMKRNILNSLLGTSQSATSKPKAVAFEPRPSLKKIANRPAPPSTAPISNGGFTKVLETIAAEVGVDVSDLADNAKVTDLGVDSLLTISILGRLRTETELDLPSSLFITYPTVTDLRNFFSDKLGESPQSSPPAVPHTPSSYPESASSSYPSSYAPSYAPSVDSEMSSAMSTPPEAEAPDSVAILKNIIAHEVGIEISEILPSTPFAEIGVDSLLTISILDAFKTQLGVDLPAMFFQENPTIADVQKALGVPKSSPKPVASAPPTPTPSSKPPQSTPASTTPTHRAKSVLLQGRPSPGRQNLFLLPDGAGSLFSYISLPALPSGIPVYGLDSPFHNNPSDYTISFSEVAAIYISAIRSIQPKGPYMLGGWSLGGIHAYETSRQLIEQGETITNLLMIDSPCPGTLPPLPSPTLNLLEKAGIFDGLSSNSGPVTERTRLHFLGCVRALENYTASPIPASKAPGQVTVIWAQDGVLEGRDDAGEDILASEEDNALDGEGKNRAADMNKAKQWLTGKRTSFGPNGWDRLTGKGDGGDGEGVMCHVVGGNHFSIMFPPKISAVAAAMAKGLPEK